MVKCPGQLAISVYASCPDVSLTVTPDLKAADGGASALLYVDLGCGRHRTGGSALAHVFGQLGESPPDQTWMSDPPDLRAPALWIATAAAAEAETVAAGGASAAAIAAARAAG